MTKNQREDLIKALELIVKEFYESDEEVTYALLCQKLNELKKEVEEEK